MVRLKQKKKPNEFQLSNILVLRELSSDKCLHEPSICTHIDPNAVCDKDKNHCLCKGGLYQSENRCGKKRPKK